MYWCLFQGFFLYFFKESPIDQAEYIILIFGFFVIPVNVFTALKLRQKCNSEGNNSKKLIVMYIWIKVMILNGPYAYYYIKSGTLAFLFSVAMFVMTFMWFYSFLIYLESKCTRICHYVLLFLLTSFLTVYMTYYFSGFLMQAIFGYSSSMVGNLKIVYVILVVIFTVLLCLVCKEVSPDKHSRVKVAILMYIALLASCGYIISLPDSIINKFTVLLPYSNLKLKDVLNLALFPFLIGSVWGNVTLEYKSYKHNEKR